MKKILNSKILLSVLALVLIAAMALGFAACGNKTTNDTPSNQVGTSGNASEDATQIGQGEKSFVFEVIDKDNSKTVFKVKTDADTVGAALAENNLIAGAPSEYGLMVDTVNGIKYDYTADEMYWAFYIDGAYAQTGVDSTPIDENSVYAFAATAA